MRLYNTATRGLDELPSPSGPIRMYVCGPTVYQRIHIGNARPFVISMWLKRWLEHQGYNVTLVENITDINNKIYAAAPGHSAEFAQQASQWYIEDTGDLGLGRPDHEPKATETVPEIVALIQELIDRDLAYEAGGDVYFRVARFTDYGRLSGRHEDASAMRNPSEEEEQSALKENPRDFALWKAHKEREDTWWDSPWGRGRPGWHIECSAMAEKHLGPVFEIHGGGLDLVFPHHENEIAHWRKPMDYTEETLVAAKARADGFREVFRNPSEAGGSWEQLVEALDDDFNTPEALAVMHEWRDHDLLRRALDLFGLASLAEAAVAPPELEELARRRAHVRANGDFGEADRLRQEIEDAGWEVRDLTADPGYRLVPKR